MVQRQGARPAWLPNVGKHVLRQLCQHEIFFIKGVTGGFHGANPKFCRDIVQACARHMKQYVVEGTANPAAGLRVKVDYVGPECWNVGRGYVLVGHPQVIIACRQGLDGYRDEQRGNARDLRDSVRQAIWRLPASNGKGICPHHGRDWRALLPVKVTHACFINRGGRPGRRPLAIVNNGAAHRLHCRRRWLA